MISIHGQNYQTDAGNRLLSDGVYNYEYDDEGNMISRTEIATGAVQEYQWDYRNRMIAVIDKDSNGNEIQRVDFGYDVLDRRIAKIVDTTPANDGDETATYFVYDGEDVHLELTDNDGINGVNQPVLTQRYLHGAGVDQVMAQEDGNGNVQWLLSDHLGTIRDLVNNNGDVVNHLTYDSFGRVITQTNSNFETRYQFTGREFDEETGLYYYRARYYNAEIGRFISEDPIGFNGGDGNLYRYVFNRPVSLSDPTGEIIPLLAFGLIATGGLVGGTSRVLTQGGGLGSFGRGFLSGSVGTATGLGVGLLTKNPFASATAGAATSDALDQLLFGDCFNFNQFATNTAIGGLTGGLLGLGGSAGNLASKIPGLQTVGRLPKVFKPRTFSEFGKNSQRLIGQELFNSTISSAVGAGVSAAGSLNGSNKSNSNFGNDFGNPNFTFPTFA